MKKKNPEHYVDNDELREEIMKYTAQYKVWAEEGKDPLTRPRLTEKAGSMLLNICKRVSFSRKFINYPYREEMVSDGLENCIMYAHNYNPEISMNAFAYFTQYAFYANVGRINKEKHEMLKKAKYVQSIPLDDELLERMGGEDDHSSLHGADSDNSNLMDFLRDYYNVELLPQEKEKLKKLAKKQSKLAKPIVGMGLFSNMNNANIDESELNEILNDDTTTE